MVLCHCSKCYAVAIIYWMMLVGWVVCTWVGNIGSLLVWVVWVEIFLTSYMRACVARWREVLDSRIGVASLGYFSPALIWVPQDRDNGKGVDFWQSFPRSEASRAARRQKPRLAAWSPAAQVKGKKFYPSYQIHRNSVHAWVSENRTRGYVTCLVVMVCDDWISYHHISLLCV